jgi:hypothetical protein
MVMKKRQFEKLIWQKNSPAPYESAWCVFIKLVSLNVITYNDLASLISIQGSDNRTLDFWTSSWIDFEKFSNLLGVKPSYLESGYLDQLNFYTHIRDNYTRFIGIKLCSECVKIGYHCIFFQLGFINFCPWHHTKLEEPCQQCFDCLNKRWFKEESSPSWDTHKSACGHVVFDERKVPSSNMLSEAEQSLIIKYCMAFIDWWDRVSKCVDVWKFLSKTYFNEDDLKLLPKYLSAAELIAGVCPWLIETSEYKIRTICWKQLINNGNQPTGSLDELTNENNNYESPRKSEVDIIYRAIRRYFFRRFVKSHRSCWIELSNYSYNFAQVLSVDKVCIVTMAYIAWRLSIERFINLEVLKVGKVKEKPILKFRLCNDEYEKSIQGQASIMYAHFFYIWEDIDRLSKLEGFGISLSHNYGEVTDFAVSYNFEEWLLLLPNHKFLELTSYFRCCGHKIPRGWMMDNSKLRCFSEMQNNSERAWVNSLIFEAHERSKYTRPSYSYINV